MAAALAVSGLAQAGDDATRLAPLADAITSQGGIVDGTVEHRPDGLVAITFAGLAIPGDLAAQAARWAVRLKARFPHSRVAMSSSRTHVPGQLHLGEVVAEAMAILPQATGDAVQVDDATGHLLEGRFELQPGLCGTSRLLFEKDIREVPRTLMGKELPCFGREREIALLQGLWQETCESSTACVVVLAAPAGGGKSRVRDEFWQRIQGQGQRFELLLGRGDPMRDAAPFALLGPALLGAAGLCGGEPEPLQRERLTAQVARFLPGEAALRSAAFLGEIAGLPFPDHDLPALRAARKDPRAMADQRLMAWLEWLEAEAEQHPILLVLEDLHWGDAPSIAFVDAALRVLAQKPFMVLALARPEVDRRFPSLWSARNPQRVNLAPLSQRSSQRLVEHVAGQLPEASARWIVDRAQGSPFYLQELLRVAAEGGPVGDDSNLPDSILGMVQARLDSFGREAKLVLRAASVFGESFRADGAQALLDLGRRKDVDGWLTILEQQEVVYCRPNSDPREYGFRHALFRQAAYELLPPPDKRLAHLLAARHLELTGERNGRVLADHFERAGENPSAVTWLLVAAQQALDANDVAATLAQVERAVRLGAAGEELCRLRIVESGARFWRGEYREAEVAAREALLSNDQRIRLAGMSALLDALGSQSKYAEVRVLYGGLERPADPELLNPWLDAVLIATAYLSADGDDSASDRSIALLDELEAVLEPKLVVRGLLRRAAAARRRGDMTETLARCRQSVDICRGLGLFRDETATLGNLGIYLGELGQLEEAEFHIKRVLTTARKLDLKHLLTGSLQALTNFLAYHGLFDQARVAGSEAIAAATAGNDRWFQGFAQAYLSVTEFLASNPIPAEAYARDAMATWGDVPFARPFAVALLARALVAQGRVAEALPHAREAYAQLEKMGGVDDGEATIRLALAECVIATGDREAAQRAATSAAEWLQARADKIDHPPYRESFLTRIPEHRRIQALARDLGA
jgi:tetratricopeptide (TPR) repeat protein